MYSCFMKHLRTCGSRCVVLRSLQTGRLWCSGSKSFAQPCHSEEFGMGLSGESLREGASCSAGDAADTAREFRQQIHAWFSPFHV